MKSTFNVAAKLVLQAGWAPILVFLLNIILSLVDVYHAFPPADIPVHFLGGLAMAYFLSRCFAAIPEDAFSPAARPIAQLAFVITATATVAIFWEFAEFILELFGIRSQVSLEDTLLDLAMGILGGVSYMLVGLRRGTLGLVFPVDPKYPANLS